MLPIRNEKKMTTGSLVSASQPGQMVTVTTCQFAIAKMTSTAVSDTQMIVRRIRSEEHTSELQSLMRISYAVFCLKKKKKKKNDKQIHNQKNALTDYESELT